MGRVAAIWQCLPCGHVTTLGGRHMTQAHSFARASLHRLLVRMLATVAICTATAAHASGDGLTISGVPPKTITVGQTLSFTPTVSDPTKLAALLLEVAAGAKSAP